MRNKTVNRDIISAYWLSKSENREDTVSYYGPVKVTFNCKDLCSVFGGVAVTTVQERVGRASDNSMTSVTLVWTPLAQAQEQNVSFSESKMLCWLTPSLSVCPTPVCIGTHKNDHLPHVKLKDAVINDRVWWFTETQKDQTLYSQKENIMYFCTVN